MMRQVAGDALGDFAAFYKEDVEVVSVARPQPAVSESLSQKLINSRRIAELRWVQDTLDRDAPSKVLPGSIDDDVMEALTEDISEASGLLGTLMDCEQVGVRLEALHTPMCPRFHADYVPCRMLITLSGAGTEWIANDDVDWTAFADRESMDPPMQADAEIRQFPTGNWSLLKGGSWSEHFAGVVHRSPHNVGERLLLTLDPIF